MKTGIEVKTDFFTFAWFVYFCTPVIEINGKKNTRKWGTHFFELPSGHYNVKIYFHYLFQSQCGANQIQVNLAEGQIQKVSFYMPPWMMAKGTIKLN